MLKWQNPLLTLGERCLAFSENEMNNGVKESYPNSFTSPRIIDYFSICTRLINGKEVPLPLTKGNWCSSGGCYAMHMSLLPGEKEPHGYRVGVIEVVSDLQKNGLYREIDLVRSGKYLLQVGDVIIFDRSNPNNPDSKWWRHFGRVHSINGNSFKCLSGNNCGTWKISHHNINQNNLLGFGAISENVQDTNIEPIDWSDVDLSQISPKIDTGHELSHNDIFDIYKSLK